MAVNADSSEEVVQLYEEFLARRLARAVDVDDDGSEAFVTPGYYPMEFKYGATGS